MSDVHRLPLVGHDIPEYYIAIERPMRWRVYSRRLVTGQLYWYWSRPSASGVAIVGPFLTPGDAHNDIERSQEYAQAGPAR